MEHLKEYLIGAAALFIIEILFVGCIALWAYYSIKKEESQYDTEE